MALITGSTKLDWSTVALQPIDAPQHITEFAARLDQAITEYNDQTVTVLSATSALLSFRLSNGATVTVRGAGFLDSNDSVVRSFEYSDPVTRETLRFTGTIAIHTVNDISTVESITLNSLMVQIPGFQATISGNIVINPLTGSASGSITQLQETMGSAQATFRGNLVLSGNSVGGDVTQISVVSGTNSILINGLSVPFGTLDSFTTVNDLFSTVSNQLNGDDLITYTNNSGVGMSFWGGAGNDTINISGLRGDTLNGGAGDDILAGGLGQDTVNGDAGNDQITMLVTAGNVDTIDAGADSDTLVLSGVVPDNHEVIVDLSSGTDQVVAIGGSVDTLTQINFENLNVSGIGSFVTAIGSDADNIIVGSNGNDTINGGAGNDTLVGGLGNDELEGDDGNDQLDGGLGADALIGGLGNDTYIIESLGDIVTELDDEGIDTVQINRSVDLNQPPFTEIEHVVLTGVAAINANGNGDDNQLTGNSGANVLNGGDGNDILTGGLGNDTLNGGTGDDAMDGSAGNDTYVVDSALDTVTEALVGAAGGVDLVQSAVDFTLGANVEHLTLTGAGNVNGTGNALNNFLTGNSGNNQLTGGAGNDILVGGLGNDVLGGGTGNDSMAGGLGDDTYVRDSAIDIITEGLNAGTDTVQSALNYTLGANVENLELTGTAVIGTGNTLNNILAGNSGNNTLSALAGNDTLNGEAGNDTLDGGLGQDTVIGGAGNDQITMLVTAGNVDTIDAGADTDMLVLSGVVGGNGMVEVNLSAADQVVSIAGDGTRDTQTQTGFEGVNGALLGSAMAVTGSAGDNSIIGSNGADTIDGGDGHDTLLGGGGNDTLIGGLGNDVLNGGTGTDGMTGGQGDDTYVIDSLLDVITEAAGDANDTVQINRTVDLTQAPFQEIEHVVLTGAAALNATGDGGNNQLTGNSGANVLNGGDGNDILTGGLGNDTLNGGTGDDAMDGSAGNDMYVVDSALDTVTEALAGAAGGVDVVQSAVDFTLGANVENLTLTGTGNVNGTGNGLNNILAGNSGNNQLTGGAGNDSLTGGAGNDTLDGGIGTDKMAGGLGDDTYTVDLLKVGTGATATVKLADTLTESLNQGTDTVILRGVVGDLVKTTTLTLGANLEQLDASQTGSTKLNLTGNTLSNTLTGNDADNLLSGLAGNDTLHGGVGNDSLDGGLGQDTVTGGAGNDQITMLVTTGNVDTIDAGADSDTLVLSGVVAGNHEVVVDLSQADQVVSIGGTADALQQSNFENLNAAGIGSSVTVTGSTGDNLIIGSKGNDIINGGLGNDTMSGGLGNDTYRVDSAGDVVTEAVNAGTDTVYSSVSYTLGENIENMWFEGYGTTRIGTGNTLANTIIGPGGGSFILYGLAGNDNLLSADGNDILDGGAGNDYLNGYAGNDTLIGGDGNDYLYEDNGGNDVLIGGVGNDKLFGGPGNDVYRVNRGDGRDTIWEEFDPGGNDLLAYGTTINPIDLVLSRQVNDLRIALHGTTDSVTIQNWYVSPTTAQVETIQAGNGQHLHNTQVEQLIQAMAAFTTQTGLSWDAAAGGSGTAQQQTDFQNIIAANWQ